MFFIRKYFALLVQIKPFINATVLKLGMQKVNQYYILLLMLILCFGCGQEKTETTSKNQSKVDIPIYNFNELEPLLYTQTNKTCTQAFFHFIYCKLSMTKDTYFKHAIKLVYQ